MNNISDALLQAVGLLIRFDPDLYEIILLSLQISLTSLIIATLIGLPIAGILSVIQFPFRGVIVGFFNAMMGLPPVVVGLIVYLLLSRSGPLGTLGLLYTPTAMIIAQTLLITPLIIAIARQNLFDLYSDYQDQLTLFGLNGMQKILTMLFEGRMMLLTAILAGFGRAIAEVGAVMIVGGNIDHHTRVMTTAIALETSKGELAMALGLGIVLLLLALLINLFFAFIQDRLIKK